MTQQELIAEVRNLFLSDKELYNALVASIESEIKELPKYVDRECVARRIADRVVGREE